MLESSRVVRNCMFTDFYQLPIIIFHISYHLSMIQLALAVYFFYSVFKVQSLLSQRLAKTRCVFAQSPLWAYILIWTYTGFLLNSGCQNKLFRTRTSDYKRIISFGLANDPERYKRGWFAIYEVLSYELLASFRGERGGLKWTRTTDLTLIRRAL